MCDTSNGYFLLLKFSLFCEKVRHGVQHGKLPSALICVGILLAVISSHYTWSGPDGEAQHNFCSRRAVAAQQHQQQHVCSDSGSSRIALNNWSNHRHSLNISVSINRAGWDVQLCTTPDLTECNCKQGKFNMDQQSATNPPITKWSTSSRHPRSRPALKFNLT